MCVAQQIGVVLSFLSASLIWLLLVSERLQESVDELFVKAKLKLQYPAPLECEMKTAIKMNTSLSAFKKCRYAINMHKPFCSDERKT